ncbi:MAG: hypothetical protein KA479_04330 [Saprospiraceae bacterium]|nr:hypothetical protein [Saprospiraceae bacterium]
MQSIRSTGTKDEILLTKTLCHRGLRYRKNDKGVVGKHDLTFKRFKLAIFVGSEEFNLEFEEDQL